MNRRTVAVSYLIKFVLENFHSTNVDGVIHNVLPSDFWRAAQTPIVAHSGAPRLVYCGRVIRGKGVETILRAADALRARGRVLGVDVIGSGYFLDELKRVYRHPDNIFHGYVLSGEKYRIMSEAHSFVSLHPAEPFGITTLEAFTLGLNCCVSSLGGHNEVIAKEAIFRINDPGDYLEVAAVVEQSISIERKHYNRSDVNGVQYFREYAERFLKLLGPV
jgi:glycosyltransferase involved in cell wall biosynthesis